MSLGSKLLSRVLDDKSTLSAYHAGIDSQFFNDIIEREVWAYIIKESMAGNFPSPETVKRKFPAFEYNLTTETQKTLSADLFQEHVLALTADSLMQIADMIQDKDAMAPQKMLIEAQKIIRLSAPKRVAKLSSMKHRIEDAKEMKAKGVKLLGLSTGINFIDRYTLGVQPDDFWIVQARPYTGKTMFICLMALFMATSLQKRVLVLAKEMTAKRLLYRIDGMCAHIPSDAIKLGNMDATQLGKYENAASWAESCGGEIFIPEDIGLLKPSTIRAQMEIHNPDIVFVDSLTLMSTEAGKAVKDWGDFLEVTRSIKQMSLDSLIPTVATHQSKRGSTKDDKVPGLEDLGYGDSASQDIDVCLSMMQNPDLKRNRLMKVGTCKNRDGDLVEGMLNWSLRQDMTISESTLSIGGS